MGVATAIVAAVAIAGAAYSGYSAYKQAKAQKKAAKRERKVNNEAARRDRVRELRKGRMARAEAMNAGVQMGATGSSGLLGGAGSIGSQTGSNIGWSNFSGGAANYISKQQQNANNWGMRGTIAGQASSLAFSTFGNMGGWGQAQNLFGEAPKPQPGIE